MSPELLDQAIRETRKFGHAKCIQTSGGCKVEIFARDLCEGSAYGVFQVAGLVHPQEGGGEQRKLLCWTLEGIPDAPPNRLSAKINRLVLSAGYSDGKVTQLKNNSWNITKLVKP